MCGRIVQSHWQVSQHCNLPQPGPGKPDTKEMLCALLHLEAENWHPARGKLPQRDDYETSACFGITQTFWHTAWVRGTLLMCIWAPLPAELPLHRHWFPFQVTSVHKVWCNSIENVHVLITGYSIKYAGTLKYISDRDDRQSDWICVRGLWWTLKCLHLRGNILFYRHPLLLDLFFLPVTNL